MFTKTDEELEEMGAKITTREIQQQPDLWQEAFKNYTDKKSEIDNFIDKIISTYPTQKIRVIFTGAGTSAYVGDTLRPYLNRVGDTAHFVFESIPTTDIVSAPLDNLRSDDPTILVLFARSGNSPESVATVDLAEKIVKNLFQITITCAPEGHLAKKAENEDANLLLLQPALSNDKGFAMTGSFSCMTLTAALIFDTNDEDKKSDWVKTMIKMGQEVISREDEIQAYADLDYNRITYLGSGSLSGLTREAQLKVLELTAGELTTIFDSSMGFRHGPKSYVNTRTIVFDFLNNDKYTRQYDVDILEEIKGDDICEEVVGVGTSGDNNFSGSNFLIESGDKDLPELYQALPDVIFAQTFALMNSIKVKNTPDTPSASGTVNRVVKGVTIHDYE
ncbi:SIS domain-containing protein [Companilactobacillus halodurans]|uniref:SIS domain-containing protein n=1 Tax=Companilactobacillus halodurans TaxID=2584183 RepID=A0A5P0ZML3_9LACO|nr:SIS domain-containing protein [Companilactobacillus halodurans]MQS75426.1 SIS domain-containing protein [Companilactobacillus halodurans]MQS97267.1 SIS domain-containing protein [Companilactobacillus halodurans]